MKACEVTRGSCLLCPYHRMPGPGLAYGHNVATVAIVMINERLYLKFRSSPDVIRQRSHLPTRSQPSEANIFESPASFP